jgi:hypothetical protein
VGGGRQDEERGGEKEQGGQERDVEGGGGGGGLTKKDLRELMASLLPRLSVEPLSRPLALNSALSLRATTLSSTSLMSALKGLSYKIRFLLPVLGYWSELCSYWLTQNRRCL